MNVTDKKRQKIKKDLICELNSGILNNPKTLSPRKLRSGLIKETDNTTYKRKSEVDLNTIKKRIKLEDSSLINDFNSQSLRDRNIDTNKSNLFPFDLFTSEDEIIDEGMKNSDKENINGTERSNLDSLEISEEEWNEINDVSGFVNINWDQILFN